MGFFPKPFASLGICPRGEKLPTTPKYYFDMDFPFLVNLSLYWICTSVAKVVNICRQYDKSATCGVIEVIYTPPSRYPTPGPLNSLHSTTAIVDTSHGVAHQSTFSSSMVLTWA